MDTTKRNIDVLAEAAKGGWSGLQNTYHDMLYANQLKPNHVTYRVLELLWTPVNEKIFVSNAFYETSNIIRDMGYRYITLYCGDVLMVTDIDMQDIDLMVDNSVDIQGPIGKMYREEFTNLNSCKGTQLVYDTKKELFISYYNKDATYIADVEAK